MVRGPRPHLHPRTWRPHPMELTIRIHPSWLQRPDGLRRMLVALAALEHEAPTPPETAGPGRPAPARTRSRTTPEPTAEEEDPPTDGRQLLGWASKQDPDAKGAVMSFGKRNGFPSKIVSWTAEQVRAAYRH